MTERRLPGTETDSTTDRDGGVRTVPADPQGVAGADCYESEDGIVIYDVDNPLAWIEGDTVLSLATVA